MSSVNQFERAAAAWDVLTDLASRQKTEITYGELGAKIGIHHRAVRFVLGVLLDYCEASDLPPLTVLVVNQSSRQPGIGFLNWYGQAVEYARSDVISFDWLAQKNPFSEILGVGRPQDIVSSILRDPEGRDEALKGVPGRGYAQSIFRHALLECYGEKCCVCGLGYTDALQAAHIIPWGIATWAERSSPQNGLLMCANHHLLYDRARLGISQNGTIRIDRESGDLDHRKGAGALTDFEGKKIRKPHSSVLGPSKSLLMRRFQDDDWV